MLKRFIKITIFTFVSFVISLTLFASPITCEAASSIDNGDNPLKIVIESSDNIQESGSSSSDLRVKAEEYPDLGDEQVFPFVAGLGKNSGKE